MATYINKDALMAEIDKRIFEQLGTVVYQNDFHGIVPVETELVEDLLSGHRIQHLCDDFVAQIFPQEMAKRHAAAGGAAGLIADVMAVHEMNEIDKVCIAAAKVLLHAA